MITGESSRGPVSEEGGGVLAYILTGDIGLRTHTHTHTLMHAHTYLFKNVATYFLLR